MKTLAITISDLEYNKFGIPNEQMSFSDFLELISREIMRQNLYKTVELAAKYGLSDMTMEEITEEVKTVRADAAGRN